MRDATLAIGDGPQSAEALHPDGLLAAVEPSVSGDPPSSESDM